MIIGLVVAVAVLSFLGRQQRANEISEDTLYLLANGREAYRKKKTSDAVVGVFKTLFWWGICAFIVYSFMGA